MEKKNFKNAEDLLREERIKDMMLQADSDLIFSYVDENGKRNVQKICHLDVSGEPKILSRLDNTFSFQERHTITVIIDNTIYVAPFDNALLNEILLFGLEKKDYKVLLPRDEDSDNLREWSNRYDEMLYRERFIQDQFIKKCIKRECKKNGLGEIPAELLKHCFKVPNFGIDITMTAPITLPVVKDGPLWKTGSNSNYYIYFPIRPHLYFGDPAAIDISRLGLYAFRGGIAVFLYSDGNTYITPDYAVIEALRAAGYKYQSDYVPLANGELINIPEMKEEWMKLFFKYSTASDDCPSTSIGFCDEPCLSPLGDLS